jgi:signal transduction histidine kinase
MRDRSKKRTPVPKRARRRRAPASVRGSRARERSVRNTKTNALLRQSNTTVEKVLDSITDRFFGLDRHWRFTYFNKHARDLLRTVGKNPSALIGKKYGEFPLRYAADAVRRAMSKRAEIVHEFYFPPLKQWVEGRIYPTPDGGLAVYQRDITARKRAEEELRRSEAYLAEGERIAHMGSWAVKIPSGEIFWSREMFRIYQLDPARTKLSTPEVFDIIHPEDRPMVREAFARAVLQKTNYEVRHRAIVSDGTLKYLHSLGRPVLNQTGELVEYLGMVVDITKQTEVEASLRAANEKVEMILDSITDQFFAIDSQWRFTYFNQHAQQQMKALGKDPQAMIGKLLWEEFPIVHNEKALRRAMSERVPVTADFFHYPPLGEWIEDHIYPSPDGGLAVFQTYGTNRKQAEEKLQQIHAELAHVLRVTTMGEMAASIAHEINQPLGAIVNNGNVCLQLVDVPNSEEKKREALLDIVNDANRASAIIARIRSLTKRSTSERTLLSVKELIDDVLALTSHAATNAAVTITTSVPDSLRVMGDRIQLEQMLLNLVMNAIEAMSEVEDGKPTMIIQGSLGELENNPAVIVSVQDNGRGFNSESADRLFEAFFTTKPNGMGMGLGISRSIVEAHGGRLWARPNRGPGSIFCCALPLAGPRST